MAGAPLAALMAALQPPYGGNDSFTKLLINGNGPNGSTAIKDISAGAHAITPNGDVQISTVQSKFGGSSLFFGSSSAYLSLDGSSDFAFGTGDFTIEMWVYHTALGTSGSTYIDCTNGTDSTTGFFLYVNTGTRNVILHLNGAARITSSIGLSLNTWYHIALVRSAGTTRLYVDGVQSGSSYSDGNNYTSAPSYPRIGAYWFNGNFGMIGHMSPIRISKGVARWTGNFAHPARPYT